MEMQRKTPIFLIGCWILAHAGSAFSAPMPDYDTLVSSRATSVRIDQALEEVSWRVSSDVVLVDASRLDPAVVRLLQQATAEGDGALGPVFRYRYVFKNTSAVSLRLNFADPKIANSVLMEALSDYSLSLNPGEARTVQFVAVREPEVLISPVNNSIWDFTKGKWSSTGTGPASLYIPAWDGPAYLEIR
jgi:hypothetical protein